MRRSSSLVPTVITALVVTLAGCGSDHEPLPDASAQPTSGGPPPVSGEFTESAPKVTGGQVLDERAFVLLDDQSGSGSSVVIRGAELAEGSGLVVVTAAHSPTPLGVGDVPAAGARDLRVSLHPALSSGTTIRAVLYADTNGAGAFEPMIDSVVVDDQGQPRQQEADYQVR
jgi:hypothetical protein